MIKVMLCGRWRTWECCRVLLYWSDVRAWMCSTFTWLLASLLFFWRSSVLDGWETSWLCLFWPSDCLLRPVVPCIKFRMLWIRRCARWLVAFVSDRLNGVRVPSVVSVVLSLSTSFIGDAWGWCLVIATSSRRRLGRCWWLTVLTVLVGRLLAIF